MVQVPYSGVSSVSGQTPSISPAFQNARGATPDAFGAGLADSIGTFGKVAERGLTKLADTYIEKQVEFQRFDAEKKLNDYNTAVNTSYQEAQRTAAADGNGFTPNVWKTVEEQGKSFLDGLPEYQRQQYVPRVAAINNAIKMNAMTHEFKLKTDFQKRGIEENVDTAQKGISDSPNDETLAGWKASSHILVDKSSLSPAEKLEYHKKIDSILETTLAKKEGEKNPQKLAVELGVGGWRGGLGMRESSGVPTKVNQLGYAGLYQFGAPRLETLGIYKPGEGEDLQSWSKTGKDAPGKWSGTFNIPGFPEVKTFKDFLASPQAQEKAFEIHTERMNKEISQNGLDKYIGQTVGGIEITREGLRSMLHLGGVDGASRALRGEDVRDANGTSVISYAAISGKGAKRFENVPFAQREALVKDAVTRNEALNLQMENAAATQLQTAVDKLALSISKGQAGQADVDSLVTQFEGRISPKQEMYLRGMVARNTEDTSLADNAIRKMSAGEKNLPQKEIDAYAEQTMKGLDFKSTLARTEQLAAFHNAVPQLGAQALLNGLRGKTVDEAVMAYQALGRMVSQNLNVFDGKMGAKELYAAASAYTDKIRQNGGDADAAAKALYAEQNDETKPQIKVGDPEVKRFREDLMKRNVSNDVLSIFSGMTGFGYSFMGDTQKIGLTNLYARFAEENFRETGNASRSEQMAKDQLQRIAGVTHNKMVMLFPPEKAKGYQLPGKDPGDTAWVYEQAAREIFENTGDKVDLKDIFLAPLPGNRTDQSFFTGRPVEYKLMYLKTRETYYDQETGKNFPLVQTMETFFNKGSLDPRPWFADPAREIAKMDAEKYQKQFEDVYKYNAKEMKRAIEMNELRKRVDPENFPRNQ